MHVLRSEKGKVSEGNDGPILKVFYSRLTWSGTKAAARFIHAQGKYNVGAT
jgi:hypothetical protein|tara:strand:- start:73 stop:225 length:153 start_codon:yes stop_codon:yes gene_type:complete